MKTYFFIFFIFSKVKPDNNILKCFFFQQQPVI